MKINKNNLLVWIYSIIIWLFVVPMFVIQLIWNLFIDIPWSIANDLNIKFFLSVSGKNVDIGKQNDKEVSKFKQKLKQRLEDERKRNSGV